MVHFLSFCAKIASLICNNESVTKRERRILSRIFVKAKKTQSMPKIKLRNSVCMGEYSTPTPPPLSVSNFAREILNKTHHNSFTEFISPIQPRRRNLRKLRLDVHDEGLRRAAEDLVQPLQVRVCLPALHRAMAVAGSHDGRDGPRSRRLPDDQVPEDQMRQVRGNRQASC